MWPILTTLIEAEGDVIAVRQRVRRVAGLLGFATQDQIRMATAVSEIARNALVYAGVGRAELLLQGESRPQIFVVRISDRGSGIEDLGAILEGRYRSRTGLGMGITGARRLVDRFDIGSEPGRGTEVVLGKLLPASAPLLTPARLADIAGRLAHDRADDPNVALREQNRELIESMEQLRARDEELRRLNQELEDTNRGVVALYAELDQRADQLRASEERLNLALSSAEIGTWDYDPLTGDLRWDERCKALLGLAPEAEVTCRLFYARLHPDDRASTRAAIEGALAPAGDGAIGVEVRTRDASTGEERWVAAKGRATFAGEPRRVIRLIGTMLDIGVHKQAEMLMRRAMEHQEVLTREVSHRVKNSLQLVASLLHLQAHAAGDPQVRQAITDAEMRIGTVARVHDHLWRQSEVSIVDLAVFLRDLCDNLQATAPAQHCLVCEAESIMIPTDQAIPLGLLVNELVTNAFKYAYPGGDGGEIRVSIGAADATRIRLEVSDRGVGLPQEFGVPERASTSSSLGMRLLGGFARQLGGRLTVSSNDPGARFALEIPRRGPEHGTLGPAGSA